MAIEIRKEKGKQTTIYIGDSRSSGIAIEINKKKKTLYIHGWYDSLVGIAGDEIKLSDLIDLFK